MPLFLLYIIGVTFIVLAMAFRSIVVSGIAAITTILSAFVAFQGCSLVVQEGYLLGLIGLDRTGPIESFIPPIAFAILFELSMDYMVFLMSRIREEHVHGLKTREAVEHGIAAIGRVVVAAALIMGTVFAAFILTSDRVAKEFGLLLAVAILTDALVVRMTLVPAFLTLMGEKSWYMPRWLDRLLPSITVESPHDADAPRGIDVERPAEVAGRHDESPGAGSGAAPPRARSLRERKADSRGKSVSEPGYLRQSLAGAVLAPDAPDYDAARRGFNALVDRRPAAVARCTRQGRRRRRLRVRAGARAEVAVRGGGYNPAGHCVCDDGLVIDLSAMRGVEVDAERGSPCSQGGATWLDFDTATQAAGLVTPGAVGSTGVAGLTLGRRSAT